MAQSSVPDGFDLEYLARVGRRRSTSASRRSSRRRLKPLGHQRDDQEARPSTAQFAEVQKLQLLDDARVLDDGHRRPGRARQRSRSTPTRARTRSSPGTTTRGRHRSARRPRRRRSTRKSARGSTRRCSRSRRRTRSWPSSTTRRSATPFSDKVNGLPSSTRPATTTWRTSGSRSSVAGRPSTSRSDAGLLSEEGQHDGPARIYRTATDAADARSSSGSR